MPFANHQKNFVKYSAINVGLERQSIEGVAITLELVSTQLAVYHGHVDANRARPYAHFLDDTCVAIAFVLGAQSRQQRLPYIVVTHQASPSPAVSSEARIEPNALDA
jgi:hypothetical protein